MEQKMGKVVLSEDEIGRLRELEERIGYRFSDAGLLYQALVHRSWLNERPELDLEDNERLEFLGDSILEFVTTKYLYDKYPGETEGRLTMMRAVVVDRRNCARIAREMRLGDFVLVGRGERVEEGTVKNSILANAFEAIVASIFLDGGMERARDFVLRMIEKYSPDVEKKVSGNFKAELQVYVQREHGIIPRYEVVSAMGPNHQKIFEVKVLIGGKVYGQGKGLSKKAAEQAAAKSALRKMRKKKK